VSPLLSHVRAARLLVAPLLSLAVMAVMPQLAAATTPLAPGSEGATPRDLSLARAIGIESARGGNPIGFDISYPQCGGPFPSQAAFAIVGVNHGLVFSANPCVGADDGPSELDWAGMHAQFYANTGNPGPDLSSHWPDGQTSPRECNTASSPGRDTIDCAYDYGWNAAADSYASAVRAYVSLGWADADAERTPVANEWWLDVETGNSWRADPALNVASLQGSVDYLEYVGVVGVGFYSTGLQWGQVTGSSSAFSEYRSWVAGARSLHGAKERCVGSGFTGGGVTMSQYLAQGFDANYLC
jgi:hypothetical protein